MAKADKIALTTCLKNLYKRIRRSSDFGAGIEQGTDKKTSTTTTQRERKENLQSETLASTPTVDMDMLEKN